MDLYQSIMLHTSSIHNVYTPGCVLGILHVPHVPLLHHLLPDGVGQPELQLGEHCQPLLRAPVVDSGLDMAGGQGNCPGPKRERKNRGGGYC